MRRLLQILQLILPMVVFLWMFLLQIIVATANHFYGILAMETTLLMKIRYILTILPVPIRFNCWLQIAVVKTLTIAE